MNNKANVGDAVRSMAREVETELVRLIAYANDEVVPEVRRSSSMGLRIAAAQLGRMAEHLDRGARKGGAAGPEAASAAAQASR